MFYNPVHLPAVFEALRGVLLLWFCVWFCLRTQLQSRVLRLQVPQEFDEGPKHRPVAGPPAQNPDGERETLQTGQNHARLGNTSYSKQTF